MADPVRITVNTNWREHLRQPVTNELEKLGARIEAAARNLVPVDTGKLRNSLTHQVKGFTLMVGSRDVDYSMYVEYGTSRMRAQPYLRPAIESAGRTFGA